MKVQAGGAVFLYEYNTLDYIVLLCYIFLALVFLPPVHVSEIAEAKQRIYHSGYNTTCLDSDVNTIG